MMHYLVPVYMTYICIEIFSGALRGCGDVRAHHHHSVCVCIMRIVWLAVALPFKHGNFRWWNSATHCLDYHPTVLFAIYYKGWLDAAHHAAAQNAKTQK